MNIHIKMAAAYFIFACTSVMFSQQSTGTIRGAVIDPDGFPARTVDVFYGRKTNTRPYAQDGVVVRTDENGRFQILDLIPGTYVLRVKSYVDRTVYNNDDVSVLATEPTTLSVKLQYEDRCSKEAYDKTAKLADVDKAEIVNQILAEVLAGEGFPDVDRKTPIVISKDSIDPKWIKSVADLEFEFLDPVAIQKRADEKGYLLHLKFFDWKIGRECVVVSIGNTLVASSKSDQIYLLGGGVSFVFRKESGKWKGRGFGSWIV